MAATTGGDATQRADTTVHTIVLRLDGGDHRRGCNTRGRHNSTHYCAAMRNDARMVERIRRYV